MCRSLRVNAGSKALLLDERSDVPLRRRTRRTATAAPAIAGANNSANAAASRGLAGSTHAETLRSEFSMMGEVTGVDLVTDPETGQSLGYAFVTMGSPPEVAKAIAEMNGFVLEGRSLRVNEAEERQRIVE